MGENDELAATAAGMIDRVLKASGQVIWTARTDGTIIDGQGAVEEILGAPVSEVIGHQMLEMVSPEVMEKTVRALDHLVETGEPARGLETKLRHPDGSTVDVRVGGVMSEPDENGERLVIGVATDVSAEKEAKRKLEAERIRFLDAFRMAPVGILLVHLDPAKGVFIVRANDEACRIAEMPREEIEGVWMRDTGLIKISKADRDEARDRFEALRNGSIRKFAMDRAMTTPSGLKRVVRSHVAALKPEHWNDADSRHEINGTIHIEDVTTQVDARERLQYLASHDALTGLWNRQYFSDCLESHLTGNRRADKDGALVVLDLDNFKSVNDSWGHQAGDGVLQAVSGLIRSNLRDSDVVARLGGDEFAVLLAGVDRNAAERVASQINSTLSDSKLPISGSPESTYSPRASIGVLVLDAGALGADHVLQLCDRLMYEAKDSGGDRHVVRQADELRL